MMKCVKTKKLTQVIDCTIDGQDKLVAHLKGGNLTFVLPGNAYAIFSQISYFIYSYVKIHKIRDMVRRKKYWNCVQTV